MLSIVEKGYLRAVVSQPVLMEAERNIRTKMPAEVLQRYYDLVKRVPWALAPVPRPRDRERYLSVVTEKDGHVIAAAVACGAPFLITLDRPFLGGVNRGGFGILALTPGDFIIQRLPQHPDLPPDR